jgi:hypothetical protein
LCKVLLFICTLFTLQIVYNELRKICGFPPSFLFPLFSCSFSSSSQLPLPLRPSFLSPLFIPFSPFLSSNLHVPQHTMTLLSRSYHLETFIYQEIWKSTSFHNCKNTFLQPNHKTPNLKYLTLWLFSVVVLDLYLAYQAKSHIGFLLFLPSLCWQMRTERVKENGCFVPNHR